jgi:thiol-disulfide isomerase/thioredoxin
MLMLVLGAALALGAAPAGAQPDRPAPVRRSQPHDYVLLAPDTQDGAEMIGRRAPSWSFERWIRSSALTPQDLRGKVVLLRWWTDGCDYCAATLPGLEALRKRHADDGLVVIGVYHPKPPRAVSDRDIVAMANRLGFSGPIAVDQRWTTLERYWLAGHEREFTSVSFLIDREGVIRWVQRGGEYHPSTDPKHERCDADYRGLEKALAALLERS